MTRKRSDLLVVTIALLGGCAGSSIIDTPDATVSGSDGSTSDGGPLGDGGSAGDGGSLTDSNPLGDGGGLDAAPGTDVPDLSDVVLPSADAAPMDPCMGVPTAGRCRSATTVEYCAQIADVQTPDNVRTVDCGTNQMCMVVGGRATCALTTQCQTGDTECLDPNTLHTCTAGTWASTACPTGCTENSGGGAACTDPAILSPASTAFRLVFQRKPVNMARTDWGALENANAEDFLVVLVHGGRAVAGARSGVGATAGLFTLRLPVTPDPMDRIVVTAIHNTPTGAIDYMVANPQFATVPMMATQQNLPFDVRPAPTAWNWSYPVPATPVAGENMLTILDTDGSGAANVYNGLGQVARFLATTYPTRPPRTVITWLQYGTTWSCGVCAAPVPISAFNTFFDTQIWIPADSNERYYADAVNAHEEGHWVMGSYTIAPGEGGGHALGIPGFPGLAWSEGWATFFSSERRNDPYYIDKQGGTLFYLNIATRMYEGPTAWLRPSPMPVPRFPQPAGPALIQLQDENDVSAMLWDLSLDNHATDIYAAFGSPRMNTTPFPRGYTRYSWAFDATMRPAYSKVTNTGVSAPMFADFLDALNCRSYPRDRIDRATVPAMYYPYPSASPLCP